LLAYRSLVTRRRLALTAALTAVALGLSGCSLIDSARQKVGGSGSAVTVTPVGPPPGETSLTRYYNQSLSWSPCSSYLCAGLTVPLSYDDPTGQTIKIAVLRVPAKDPANRIGSLVVNPGGPGGSGVDYAAAADYIVGPDVRDRYDVVGFDPRGVDRSEPIDCVGDRGLDAFLGADPTPDDPAEEQQYAAGSQAFAAACGKNAGPLLGHVSTQDVARDMDILRAALGEQRLTYLGKSYGTLLGSTYADLFPTHVGRMVLDGVVPPDLSSAEINLGQAQGFERATRAWAGYCVDQGGCPLGGSVETVMRGLRDFLLSVDRKPLGRTGDSHVTELTEGWASLGIADAMYSQSKWGDLVDAMSAALGGDGSGLMALADDYADRRSDGTYGGNIMEVIYAVNCLDQSSPKDLAVYEKEAKVAEAVAPTWGRYLMWSSLTCGYWPIKATGEPHRVTAEGAGPIVVIGTTRDPATPYEWSVRLNDELADSALITYDGDGHTAYTRSNACVDNAVDAYYINGTVPQDGLTC
jgi:pimeloyl-ACP methyl ester carboxylesterase